jgi:cytochrome c biogenesis protein CcmG/thiol:disulfide interchange protein DsbE
VTSLALREVARGPGLGSAAMLLLLLAPGCRTEPPPSYVRIEGTAPALRDVPPSKAVLVVFWASWCPPCRAETPELLELAAQPPEELRGVVYSHDTDMRAVRDFLGEPPPGGLHLRLDEGRAVAHAFGVDSLPTSILVVDGRLAARFPGPRDWSSRAMRRLLERLIREHSPAAPAPSR